MKLGTRVKVNYEASPFTGTIQQIKKWKNPISRTKGIDYVVKADDDGKLYGDIPITMIEKL